MCRALRTFEAAKAKGDDGKPDFAARKECNYLVSVLQVMQKLKFVFKSKHFRV